MPIQYLVVKSSANISLEPAVKQKILNKYGADDWDCFSMIERNTYTEFSFKKTVKSPPKPRKKKDPTDKG